MREDRSGEFWQELDLDGYMASLEGAGAGMAIGAIAAGASIAAVDVIEKTEERNNFVYVLKDSAGVVQYVGRTNNLARRKAAHEANPARAGMSIVVLQSGLTLKEARALEQAAMIYYHTKNTANRMNNQINSIAYKKWSEYKAIARGVLDYTWNKMTNEILYWIEN